MAARRILSAALLAVLCAAPAAAATKGDAARLEKQRKEQDARAQALKIEADRVRREAMSLRLGLSEVDNQKAAAEQAKLDAEANSVGLDARELQLTADIERDRRALERMVANLLQADQAAGWFGPALSQETMRAGVLARLWIPPIASRVEQSTAALDATRKDRDALDEQRAALDETRLALDMERAITEARLSQAESKSKELLAESEKARKTALALAKEAKTVRELADKVSKQGNRTLRASGGRRVAPSDGRVVLAYGSKIEGGQTTRGVTLRTAPGAKVVAPANAVIGYAGSFRSYGNVLILDQGDGYALVLTGLGAVLAGPGKSVTAGETIGEMARATAAPELYFEVRQAGRPVDPERWLKAKS